MKKDKLLEEFENMKVSQSKSLAGGFMQSGTSSNMIGCNEITQRTEYTAPLYQGGTPDEYKVGDQR